MYFDWAFSWLLENCIVNSNKKWVFGLAKYYLEVKDQYALYKILYERALISINFAGLIVILMGD